MASWQRLTTKEYICPHCLVVLYTRGEFKTHQLEHLDINCHCCPYCTLRFAHKQHLQMHKWHFHRDLLEEENSDCVQEPASKGSKENKDLGAGQKKSRKKKSKQMRLRE